MNLDDRLMQRICNITAQACNTDLKKLTSNSRKQPYIVMRMAIANIALIEEEINYKTIAKHLNRDRTNIYHYKEMHHQYYYTWRLYRDTFNKILTEYRDVAEYGMSLSEFQLKLKVSDIKKVDNEEIELNVETKRFNHSLQTDLNNLIDTIKELKKILINYEHNINIFV